MKLCNECNQTLPIEMFSKNRSHSDGHESSCKVCRRKKIKAWHHENPDKCKGYGERRGIFKAYAYQALANKRAAKKYEISLTVDELTEMATITEVCPICGATLDYSFRKGKILDNSPSLDRKDNSLVVSKNNCWIVCHQCNRTKSNRSVDEFVAYMENAFRRLRS
jgi:hypothetical protein